jgi:hypothetical protein
MQAAKTSVNLGEACGHCIDWCTFLPRPLPPLPRPRPLPRPLAEVVLRAGLPLAAALAGDLGVSSPPCRIVTEPDTDQPNRRQCRLCLRHAQLKALQCTAVTELEAILVTMAMQYF